MPETIKRLQAVDAWKSRLQRFYLSSLTVREFCAAEGVSMPSFYQWQRRIKSLAPEIVPTDCSRRKRRARLNGDHKPGAPNRTSAPNAPTSSAAVIRVPTLVRSKPQPVAFQPVQLTTPALGPLATIQLPTGVIVELQHDANMICQVLERFLPLALHNGGATC